MKKPIHEEIIILQNYFKSMRAKMDGGGGVLGTGCHLSRCPAHCPATSKGWTPWLRKAGDPQAFCTRGLANPGQEIVKKSKLWTRRAWPRSQRGTVGMAFGAPALRTGGSSLQIHHLPEMVDGNFHLKPLAKLIPA